MATEEPIVATEAPAEVPEPAPATAEEIPPVETETKSKKSKKQYAPKKTAPRKPKTPAQHPPYFEVFDSHFDYILFDYCEIESIIDLLFCDFLINLCV